LVDKEKDKLLQEELKRSGEIPGHIAIIMDGNGRWAKMQGKTRVFGHREGVKSVRDIVEACGQIGVKYLTLYTFSTENWKRPKSEVSVLMHLLISTLKTETKELDRNDVKLMATGDKSSLPDKVKQELEDSILKLRNNKRLTLNLALSYSGRWDIVNACKKICKDVKASKRNPDKLTEKIFSEYLETADLPDPDLMIRTGGEFRLSNFLLWQLAYTEIYIDKEFWPAYRRNNLYEAIRNYQNRERRFGMTSEQISEKSTKHKK
jgi:undecaprenyl diphosphate synthase